MELKTNLYTQDTQSKTTSSVTKKPVTRILFNKALFNKKNIIVTLALIPAFFNTQLYSARGCLDNSRHLTQLNDNKEYHFVSCSCPCSKRIAHQDRCIDCRHAHNPEPVEILDTAQAITPEQAKQYKKYERYLESPEKTLNLRLQAMIQKSKTGSSQ